MAVKMERENGREKTTNSAIADKPRDAFRGQSRSPNMVPFDMLGVVFLLVCYSNFVRKMHRFRDAVTLKTGLRVREGH